jgi:hypothetical protein
VVPIGAGLPIVNWGEEVAGAIGETNIVDTGGGGLSPKLPISVEPNGIPARPACNVDRVGIDEPAPAVPAPPVPAPPVPAPPVPAQALVAPPGMPPPSNRGVAVCDICPPVVEQLMVVGGAGLVPGAVISVAPSGMPVGATGEPDPMARGDVALSGEVPIPPTCARVELQPRSAAARVAITNCIFMVSTFL